MQVKTTQQRDERLLRSIRANFHLYVQQGKGDKASGLIAKLRLRCTPHWQQVWKSRDFI
jgi:hypothetical protein